MHKKPPVVAITGANGYFGTILTTYFSEKGWHVVALVRDLTSKSPQANVSYKKYDMTKKLDDSMLKGVDCLVHTAYVKYDAKHKDAMGINVSGAKRLLAASRAARVKKNIFISTMSAHEEAESVYGIQKVAVEKLFNTAQDVSLRCGLIVGNGGIVKEMVGFMRSKHVVPLIGGGKQPLQAISIVNLCQVVERCATYPVHGILTIANPTVFSYRTFYETISKVFGIKVVFVPVPFLALLGVAHLIAILRIPVNFGKENVLGLKKLRSTDNTRDIAALDLKLDSLEQALRKSGIQ